MAAERRILALAREELAQESPPPIKVSQEDIFATRQAVQALHQAEAITEYIVQLINATRDPKRRAKEMEKAIDYGASPRGSIALERCARAHAWLAGRDFVGPDDVQAVAHDVLRHRLILSFEAEAQGISPDQVTDALLEQVPVA